MPKLSSTSANRISLPKYMSLLRLLELTDQTLAIRREGAAPISFSLAETIPEYDRRRSWHPIPLPCIGRRGSQLGLTRLELSIIMLQVGFANCRELLRRPRPCPYYHSLIRQCEVYTILPSQKSLDRRCRKEPKSRIRIQILPLGEARILICIKAPTVPPCQNFFLIFLPTFTRIPKSPITPIISSFFLHGLKP